MAKQLPIPPKETKKDNSFQARRAEGGILRTAFPLLTGTVDFAKSDNKKETATAFGKDVFATAFPITSWLFGIKNDNLGELRKKNTNEKNAQLTTSNEDLFGSSQKLYVEQNKILREIIEEVKSKSEPEKKDKDKDKKDKDKDKKQPAPASKTSLTKFAAGTGEITLNSAIPRYAGGIGPAPDPRAAVSTAQTTVMSNELTRPGNKSEDNKTSIVDEAEEIKQTSGVIQEDALLSKVADQSLAKIRQSVDKNRITKQEDLDFTVDQIANQQNSVPTNKLKNVINRRLRKEEFASWIDRIKKVFVSATVSASESEIPAAVPSEATPPTTPDATPTDQTPPTAGGGTNENVDDTTSKFLAAIKSRESANNYKAKNPKSSASGAYQFIDSTWQGLTKKYNIGVEYTSARDAPAEIQDTVAGKYAKELISKHGIVGAANTWFTGNPNGNMSAAGVAVNSGVNATSYSSDILARMGVSASSAQGSGAQGSNLPANDIVGLGRSLQAEGIAVSENPAFGQVGKHAVNSLHYTGQAIDLNGPPGTIEANDPVWGPKFDALKVRLEAQGYNVIWRSAGHMNHMHVDTGRRISASPTAGAQLSKSGMSMVAGDQRQSRMGLAGPQIIQVPGDCGGLLPNINMPPPGSYGEVSLVQRLGYGAGVVK
jgi:hypothetical protein